MPSFFAIVTIVLQKRAKLDYTRGGVCYNEDKYGSISIYQNKVNFIKKEVQL